MIKLTMTQIEEADDSCTGFCVSCAHEQSGVEPDGAKYLCEQCGERRVYGPSEIVLRGLARIVEEEDDDNN